MKDRAFTVVPKTHCRSCMSCELWKPLACSRLKLAGTYSAVQASLHVCMPLWHLYSNLTSVCCLIRQAMKKIGLKTPPSGTAETMEQAMEIAGQIGSYPLIIRPAFTLGGSGGGIAYNVEEFHQIIESGLQASVTNQACPLQHSHCICEDPSGACSLLCACFRMVTVCFTRLSAS